MTRKYAVTGVHEYNQGLCSHCGTRPDWPLAKQPCPRARAAINAKESRQRNLLRKARLRATEKANTP